MDLPSSLRSIATLEDLPRLVAALGHQPAWEAVPPEAWNERARHSFTITAVGRTGRLPWLAIQSRASERDAMMLARRINQRGKVALVLALDPQMRQLAVAVAFDRCPGIALDLGHPDPEAFASLARLGGIPEGGSLAFAARAADALSTEPVGRRFFREFKTTLDRMAGAFPGAREPDDHHGFVLLQLTRVLFLYFIQSKGWLAGRDQFLAQEIDWCLSHGRRIHRDFLRPLFFGTLNQPPAERTRSARRFGPIPFLNGGLFEPHPLERRYRWDIPNLLWRDAFDGLFERFHFTIAEGGPHGSVAPDMLGRVFEGVMAPDVRHASGTFYTPALLVQRLLDAALLEVLATRLKCGEAEAERRLHDPDSEGAKVVDSITVLDPAVGSGAFLLGALDRLSAFGASQAGLAARKRRVLQQSLFGVDRNAAAVRLTELRLWLAVIADDPVHQPEMVQALPNLDSLIRQGDSLFDPAGLELAAGADRPDPGLVAEISGLRQEVVAATGPNKHRLVRRLRELEAQALDQLLKQAESRRHSAIASCLDQARSHDLFGQRRGLDRELRRQLADLRLSLRGLRQTRRRLSRQGEIPWFHYQSAFADVFAGGGFDLVIGNPPWLRSEAIPAVVRRQLSGRYRWWRGGRTSYGNSPDLAVAFLERAFELSAPGGVVAMLVPAKIASAGYATAARHALASSSTIHVLADLTGTTEAAFDATVYPLALVASRTPPPSNNRVRTGFSLASGKLIRQSELRGGGPWILSRTGAGRVLAELEHKHPSLGESIPCHLGVKTGLNRVFLDPPSDLESEVLRWAIRGRDVRPFRCRPRIRLLWTHDKRGEPLQRLPSKTQTYLVRHEAALHARRDYQGGPSWALFRARPAVARYRVVWSDLARRLSAAALTSTADIQRIPLNTCYVAPVRNALAAQSLAAWLNSTWIGAIARLGAVPASGGFARFNARVVSRLPLPAGALVDPALGRLARMARAGTSIQEDLDRLTAGHLGLSGPAQRALRAAVVDSSVDHR